MTYLGWFDDGNRPLDQKIRDGATAYRERFQMTARVVLVSPGTAAQIGERLDGLLVRAMEYIRPHNFWFGEE